jgi:predicted TPR repeat methyltransferase
MTDRIDEKALAAAYNRGLKLEKAGDADGAAAAYAEALRLDPQDRGGVAVRLAALGRGPAPDRAPPAYVATLFDQHAEAFESILVDQLGYRTPQDIRAALAGRFPRMLDLGCGTGLCGAALRDLTEHRTGVDIAENMVAIAWDKGDYDDLYVGDLEGFLEEAAEHGETWQLIVAADVLPYLGDIGALFRLVGDRLTAGGAFAFSTESAAPDAFAGGGWIVGPKQRFAHDDSHLRRVLAEAGMTVERADPIVVRSDEGAPVRGQLFVARRA